MRQCKPARRSPLARDSRGLEDPHLKPSHRLILELLYHYRYATAEILGIAYEAERGRGQKKVRNELSTLFHSGLVERTFFPTGPAGHGSEQYVYTLTTHGARALLDPETFTEVRTRVYNRSREKSVATIPHRIAISTLQLILDHGEPGPALVDFTSDQEDPSARIRVRLDGRFMTFQPDATAVLEWPNGKRSAFFFEIERTHKNRARTDRRFRAYQSYLVEHLQGMRERLDVHGAVAVFVGDTSKRASRLQRIARQALGDLSRRRRPLLYFWHMETWYRSNVVQDPRDPDRVARRQSLAHPRDVLAGSSVLTLEAKERPLFMAT